MRTAQEHQLITTEHRPPPTTSVIQPGGFLRQDVPAGLALPDHQQATGENVMVEPDPVRPAAVQLGGAA